MEISSVASGSAAIAQNDGSRTFVQATPMATNSFVPDTASVRTAATQVPSPERIAQAVKQVNDAFTQNGQNLYASIESDKATGISVVKVVDKNTHEEISQYPSKTIIAMAETIDQGIKVKGLMMHVSA